MLQTLGNVSNETRGVLIAHPGRQYSHQLAKALADIGLLARYYTQLPPPEFVDFAPDILKRSILAPIVRNARLEIPRSKIRCQFLPMAGSRIVALAAGGERARPWTDFMSWTFFDRWVARRLRDEQPSAVVGVEPSCVKMFEVAKSLQIPCILDASSFHFIVQDQLLAGEAKAARTWLGGKYRARKAQEITLADWIMCPSIESKNSYVAAGVNPDKIYVNPPGCDVHTFTVRPFERRAGVLRLAFVGSAIERKGFDTLLQAVEAIWTKGISLELHVFGNRSLAYAMGARERPGQLFLHGQLSHARLAAELARMDCLVAPSVLDAFAMVVVEALAAGLPVIVSEGVGAKMAVEEGKTGWILPPRDVDRLRERLIALASQPETIRSLSIACRAKALEYSWDAYHQRARTFFVSILGMALPDR